MYARTYPAGLWSWIQFEAAFGAAEGMAPGAVITAAVDMPVMEADVIAAVALLTMALCANLGGGRLQCISQGLQIHLGVAVVAGGTL